MTIKQIISTTTVLLALSVSAAAQVLAPDARAQAAEARKQAAEERAQAQADAAAERAAARAQDRGERDGNNFRVIIPPIPPVPPIGPFGPSIDADALYDQARQAIENSQFDRAIRDLDRLLSDKLAKVNDKLSKADAAMYWKAYSQAKLDLDKDALATVAELSRQFAASPWVKDARALAVEIQQAAGQPVSAELQNDEELKLLALRGVMQADPDKGVPIIEKMLAGGASPRVRDRALFVLSQSRAARAHDVMLNTAKNNANPDLQRTAIRYLGMMGGADDREALAGIYRTATDTSVRRAILQSYMMSGNVERVVEVAKTEKDSDLRREAIRNLGVMNRRTGGSASASDALVAIYKSDSSSDIRRAVVNSLFQQRNAKALVDIARAEKDPSLKREIVSKLSVMKEPEATDYMLELLK
jgi:TolA-binding protein